jgi:Protein of unknown function (DUF3995)
MTSPAHAACAWAVLFAAANVYWGLGGRLAVPLPDAALDEPAVVALNWLAVVPKVGLGLVALATVQPWGRALPRRLLLVATYGPGAGMFLYGALGLVLDGLRLLGVLAVPPPAWTSLRWHVFLWDPWWIAGGVLFILTAGLYQRRER